MTYDEAVHKLVYEDSEGPSWVARGLAISSQSIPQWFQDGKGVPIKRAPAIAKLFGLNTAALLDGRIERLPSTAGAPEGSLDINPEVLSNFLKSPENRALLGLLIGMKEEVRSDALAILESVSRIAARKAS